VAKNDKPDAGTSEARENPRVQIVPTEFPVSLEEFLTEVPKARVEMKAAFSHLCRAEQITGRKLRAEWQTLLTLFETMPVSSTWAEWQKQGGK
jgi:hypothetical protein